MGPQVMDGSEVMGEGDSPLHPWLSSTQDPKIREVLGFGGPDARLEEKLMTVVAGPDPVNTTFLNFMAVQDDTAKVGWDRWLGLGELLPHLLSQPSLSRHLLCTRLPSAPFSDHPLTKRFISISCVSDSG